MLMKFICWAEAYVPHRKTGALIVASKEIGRKLNTDKARHIIMSQDQNAGRNHSIKTDNSSLEIVE